MVIPLRTFCTYLCSLPLYAVLASPVLLILPLPLPYFVSLPAAGLQQPLPSTALPYVGARTFLPRARFLRLPHLAFPTPFPLRITLPVLLCPFPFITGFTTGYYLPVLTFRAEKPCQTWFPLGQRLVARLVAFSLCPIAGYACLVTHTFFPHSFRPTNSCQRCCLRLCAWFPFARLYLPDWRIHGFFPLIVDLTLYLVNIAALPGG